jgi:hypothetical protein
MKFLATPRCWLLLSLLILPLTVTNDSLWLDEGDTAIYARQPDFSAWRQWLTHDRLADCQMPLAMLSAWVGGKFFGTREWQLRAVNLIWGALALVALSRVGRRWQMPWLPLLLALQPYFWFYLNEARPYALLLAGGAWLLAALVEFDSRRSAGTGWAWQLVIVSWLLFSATLLAPLSVAAVVIIGGLLAWRQRWRPELRALKILVYGLLAGVPLAIYYVETLLRGVKSSQMWPVDLKFVLYVFYEITGMGGLGISPLEIRSFARSPDLLHELVMRLPQLILPLLLGILLVSVLFIGLRSQWQTGRRATILLLAGVPLLTAMVFIAASLLLQKAFWARHYAPVFPFYVALLGLAVAGLWTDSRKWLRALPILIGVLLMWSALNFRFAPALRKENYRAAAAFAQTALAAGREVWWLAGYYSASYYGLGVAYDCPEPGKVFAAWVSPLNLLKLTPPAVIVLSRPDAHDLEGVGRKIIAENGYRMAASYQGFTIWTNPAGNPVAHVR